jgi:hypothetical protein
VCGAARTSQAGAATFHHIRALADKVLAKFQLQTRQGPFFRVRLPNRQAPEKKWLRPNMSSSGAGGPSSAAPASSSSAGSVFVKRSDEALARFAPVEICVGDAVGHLAERASHKLGWGVSAANVDLFLVPAESEDAVDSGESGAEALVLTTRPLSSIKALSAVGIRDRSCLLARLSSPPAAAPGECARSARRLPSC